MRRTDRLPGFGDNRTQHRPQHGSRPGERCALDEAVEVAVVATVFDWGEPARCNSAQTLAAVQRLKPHFARSGPSLRESILPIARPTTLPNTTVAIVPLRKQISEENTLRYNGMLIGGVWLLSPTDLRGSLPA